MFFRKGKVCRAGTITAAVLLAVNMLLPVPFNNTVLAVESSRDYNEELLQLLLELNRDLQELERCLIREVIPAIRSHRDLVRATQPYLDDRFTGSWNGIVLQDQKPVWTEPASWNGYWDLKAAREFSSSDPATEIYWPLVENPGLVEMITMDLQYLEGTAYAAATATLYTDTLVSVSLDWFAALYSDDYPALLSLAEKVTASYAIQHNLLTLLRSEGSLLEVKITPPGQGQPLSSGTVNFSSRPMVTYSRLLGILEDIIVPGGELSLAGMVIAVASAVGDEDALESRANGEYTIIEVETEPSLASPVDEPEGPGRFIYILWPLSVLAAAAGAFLLARRLRITDRESK